MIEVEVRSNAYHLLSEATAYIVSRISSEGFAVAVDFRLRPRIGKDIDSILAAGASEIFLSTQSVTFVSIDASAIDDRRGFQRCDVLLIMSAGVEDFAFDVLKNDSSGNSDRLMTMLEEAEIYLKSS